MKDARQFLQRELNKIKTNISRLEKSLESYADDDPRGDGQRAMLEIQREHLGFVKDLLDNAETPARAMAITAQRLIQTIIEHNQAASKEHSHDGKHSDEWWKTLGREEYMQYITTQIIDLTLKK